MRSLPNILVKAPKDALVATARHRGRLISALVLAFVRDPVIRWFWPEPAQYLASFPEFARTFGGRAFLHGSAHYADNFAGGALWLPPGVDPDAEAMRKLMRRTLSSGQLQILGRFREQMASHRPDKPHWYLPLIGIDPARQGHGYGSLLLRFALERIDRDGRLAYLESTNPANIALYKRYGFEALGEIHVDEAPPIFPMVRKAHGV